MKALQETSKPLPNPKVEPFYDSERLTHSEIESLRQEGLAVLRQEDNLIDHAGSYPIIGRFNANISNRVVNNYGNFGGNLFQKLILFLSHRAD